MNNTWKTLLTTAGLVLTTSWTSQVWAENLPGTGISVQAVQSTIAEETFQTLLVNKALQALGYDVQPTKEVDYNVAYTSIAKGDATFLAVGWFPLHDNKYKQAGGDDKFFVNGTYIAGAAQGYLIDKKQHSATALPILPSSKIPKLPGCLMPMMTAKPISADVTLAGDVKV